ncbi:MAG: aminopeptidase N [Sphingomonadaceae bacterium]|nr:aminopeptidase N [Sphingomonadaceae bacterium]
MPANPTIHRGDYAPADWLVTEVALHFDLGLDATKVTGDLHCRRNGAHDRPIRLDIDGALPTGLWLDGVECAWRDLGDQIEIMLPAACDEAVLRVETNIHPDQNSQLMGLYASGGMLATQCEAQGFRRIIPFIDRPDNMSIYRVHMAGSRADFPILLSNGELVASGDLGDGRHFAEWHDPWPKPCYLFALVAGQLVARRDHFTTMSGKPVELAIWVRTGDEGRTGHAMRALKNAMAWDERVYGREYDLSCFNIVAVSDFNMGAMENKGLNIFNTRYILADADTATDMDFDGVEGVVAHEYFHNWSGNRVTCRDWFQLSLKEGFTVFRDQSFSADMGSPAVKRIEDVRVLRAAQFPEDSGPLAHPIRPDSYQEISNFYTATVYNKGAEVIRMMARMAGPQRFRAATDLYFDRHDGEAATCDDFIAAVEDGAALNLDQFRLWYSQSGTPHVDAQLHYDSASGEAVLSLHQNIAPTPGQDVKQPMQIPIAVALHDATRNAMGEEQLILLSAAEQNVPLGQFATRPMLSFNRGFTAPIIANVTRADGELAWLAAHDDDPFARYEALQALMQDMVLRRIGGDTISHDAVVGAIGSLIKNWQNDAAFVAEAAMLPLEAMLGEAMPIIDPDKIRSERRALQTSIGRAHCDAWRAIHDGCVTRADDLSPAAKGRRKLRALALMMLAAAEDDGLAARALAQYRAADGMSDRMAALATLCHLEDAADGDGARQAALADFYARYGGDALTADKWFSVQATSLRTDTVEQVAMLANHADFTLANPNRVRALYGGLLANQAAFHRRDGAGYALVRDMILALDPKNPQTAARFVAPFGRWKRFDGERANLMRSALEAILAAENLSRDTREQASKSLMA